MPLLAAFLAMAAPASAQSTQDLANTTCGSGSDALLIGAKRSVVLDHLDGDASGKVVFHAVDLALENRQLVLIKIDLAKGQAPPRLSIGRCREGGFQEMAFTRDAGLSRLGFTAPMAATYRIRISGLAPQAAPISLVAQDVQPPPQPQAKALPIGEKIDASFSSDLREIISGEPYALYRVDLKKYDRVVIDASTPDGGRPVVQIGALSGDYLWQDYFEPANDVPFPHAFQFEDGRAGLVAPQDGSYIIRLHAKPGTTARRYSVLLTALGATPTAVPEQIQPNTPITGRLDIDGPVQSYARRASFLDPDIHRTFKTFKLYRLTVHAGERYDFQLNADGFDPLMELGKLFPFSRAFISPVNDKRGIGITFTADDDIIIRVSSTREGGAGSFTLTANITVPSADAPLRLVAPPTPQ